MKKLVFSVLAVLAFTVFLVGCDSNPPPNNPGVTDTTTASRNAAINAANKWGNVNITNYYEYQQLKQIYELRDNPNLILYAYLYDQFTGKLNCMGRIKGFPIPYSTELSQPTGPTYMDLNGNTVPHDAFGGWLVNLGSIPEPNGLYPSQSTNADWVEWVDASGHASPGFIEADVQVFQTKIDSPMVGVQC